MQALLTRVSLILCLLGVVFASVLEPRGGNRPELPAGFQCDDVIFTGEFIQKLQDRVKKERNYFLFPSSRLSKLYSGPPFSEPYIAWPISPKTDSYKEAILGPYRAIIKRDFSVFSVLVKHTQGIKECNMLGPVSVNHVKYSFICGNDQFANHILQSAAAVACINIQKIATHEFPVRYDGPFFSRDGEQRYLYPIKLAEPYELDKPPGPYRVVVNSACKVVGAVTVYKHGEVFRCTKV